MDAAIARKLVAGLDAEMERRWRAADPSGLTAVARMLNRLADEIARSTAGAPRHDDAVVAAEFDELIDMLDELIGKVEAAADHEDDLEAGIEHDYVACPRVRSTPEVLRPPKPSPGAVKIQRRGPEQVRPAPPASASAPSAPTSVPPLSDDGWRLGVG